MEIILDILAVIRIQVKWPPCYYTAVKKALLPLIACFLLAPAGIAAEPDKLYATLTPFKATVSSIMKARATVVVTNTGQRDAKINTITLGSPPLALQLFSPRGLPAATVAPPTPPANLQQYDVTLHPGDSRSFSYELAALVQDELPPGSYVLRMKGIPSNNVVVTIKKPTATARRPAKKKTNVRVVVRKQV